jgi:predicted DNA-binding transcriptional regulator AlpA
MPVNPNRARARRRAPRDASSPEPPVRLLTVDEVASWTTWSPRSVWAKLAAGELTPIRLGPRCTRVDAAEVEALIDRARRKAGA